MDNTFDILFLIARPAAGKSEIIDYLKRTAEETRVAAINEIERLRSLVQAVVSAANAAEFERALDG